MNFYSASVALLWVTALRAGGGQTLSGRSPLRSRKSWRREVAGRISGTPVAIRPPVRT